MPRSRQSGRDQRVHLRARAGIERAERLVEQQHPRLARQRLRDGEALLHAARERARILVAMRRRGRPRRAAPRSSRWPRARAAPNRRAEERGSPRIRSRAGRCRARSGAETPNSAGTRRRGRAPARPAAARRRAGCLPRVGRSWPRSMRRNVLLPQPEGPTIETKAPDAISRLMRSSTIWSPYSTQTSRTEIALISAAPRHRPTGSRAARQPREREVHRDRRAA